MILFLLEHQGGETVDSTQDQACIQSRLHTGQFDPARRAHCPTCRSAPHDQRAAGEDSATIHQSLPSSRGLSRTCTSTNAISEFCKLECARVRSSCGIPTVSGGRLCTPAGEPEESPVVVCESGLAMLSIYWDVGACHSTWALRDSRAVRGNRGRRESGPWCCCCIPHGTRTQRAGDEVLITAAIGGDLVLLPSTDVRYKRKVKKGWWNSEGKADRQFPGKVRASCRLNPYG